MGEKIPLETRTAWRSIVAPGGRRFDYQYDGTCPTVRAGRYESARDFVFLLMDSCRQLYRIPVRVSDEALAVARERGANDEELLRAIEKRFTRVLEEGFEPRNDVSYQELDRSLAVEAEQMALLLG